MKNLILVISLLLIINLNLFPQWSTDPNNNLIVGYGLNPELCSDSTGGCYITYEYGTTSYPRKLALERLDKYGYKPWGDKKQILGELPQQWYAEIIEDGNDGVIVSYEDWLENLPDLTTRVRVQRVDSAGNFLWGQTGVRVSVVDTNQGGQRLVSDGNGGCVIVWMISSSDYSAEYWMNRIDGDGQRVWSDTGIYIQKDINWNPASIVRASDGNYYVQIRRNLYRINQNGDIVRQDSTTLVVIVPDPEGGIVQTGITGNISNRILVSQRKDSLGNNLWQEPYVEIADSLYYLNASLSIKQNDGYFYYGWSGIKNGVDCVAQYQALRLDGSKLFPDGSISISNHTPISVAGIVPSDSSKTIFIWNDATISSSTIAQMYDILGNKLWDENGVIVSYPAIAYETTTDGQGGFITIGPIDQFTIVAQQVSKYGHLGEIVTSVPQEKTDILPLETTLYQNYPNPFNPNTTIKFAIPKEAQVNLSVFNILGEKVKELKNEIMKPGFYEVEFNASLLASGVYLYSIQAGEFVQTKKMILMK